MVMDPNLSDYFTDDFGDETVLPGFDSSQNHVNGFKPRDDPSDFDSSQNNGNGFKPIDDNFHLNFLDIPFLSPVSDPGSFPKSSSMSSELESPDDGEFSDGVFKYISQILLEENLEEKPSMFHDPLALQAAEKSLYETIGEKYPISPNRISETPSDNSNTSNGTSNSSFDPQWTVDPTNHNGHAFPSVPYVESLQSSPHLNSYGSSGYINSLIDDTGGKLDFSTSTRMVSSMLTDRESILLFKKGMEEASKFLPTEVQLNIGFGDNSLPADSVEQAPVVVFKAENVVEKEVSSNRSRGKKNHFREDSYFEEERRSKQSAVYEDDCELSELFDRVLLFTDTKDSICSNVAEEQSGPSKTVLPDGGANLSRKQVDKEEIVDLRTLLISCAQSVAGDDRTSAIQQLEQIRQHSSPVGDSTQRLANIFANGIEARMAGTGSDIYAALVSKRISATDKLKAYQLYLSACPFKKIAIFYANKMIMYRFMNGSKKKLHIIDFGIQYGFQWPILIQQLKTLPGGPPELRITGIEYPQHGFRPAELVEETGRRLAKYCERFSVPFQYHAIAQKWQTIKIEDLKIDSDEFLAVNCLLRFQHLLDETVVDNNPRDTVLELIRKTNPDIFVHSITNGSYSAPFFVTRFREALYHYSAWFDMLDANISREDQERIHLETEFFGREVMNIIACEGLGRVERPETYKQWQIRSMKAGFRMLPLNEEVLKKFRGKVKEGYHKDFVIDEAGHWMLQGWKGRILHACSCWVPAERRSI